METSLSIALMLATIVAVLLVLIVPAVLTLLRRRRRERETDAPYFSGAPDHPQRLSATMDADAPPDVAGLLSGRHLADLSTDELLALVSNPLAQSDAAQRDITRLLDSRTDMLGRLTQRATPSGRLRQTSPRKRRWVRWSLLGVLVVWVIPGEIIYALLNELAQDEGVPWWQIAREYWYWMVFFAALLALATLLMLFIAAMLQRRGDDMAKDAARAGGQSFTDDEGSTVFSLTATELLINRVTGIQRIRLDEITGIRLSRSVKGRQWLYIHRAGRLPIPIGSSMSAIGQLCDALHRKLPSVSISGPGVR